MVANVFPMISQSLLQRVLGVSGRIRPIRFRESDRQYDCLVPDDSLWSAVKDNLILREYERAGILLPGFKGTIIDAGAHVGLFSLRAASYASRVIALEPHPLNYQLLQFNVRKNAQHGIHTLRRALGQNAGTAQLFEGNDSVGPSLIRSSNRSFPVTVMTLDEVVADNGPVDLLKLDIEGAEFPVLEGATHETLNRISSVAAEIHATRDHKEPSVLVDRLQRAGFRVTVLAPPIYYWRDSVTRTLRNWSSSDDLRRLKSAVLLGYTMQSLARMTLGRSGRESGGLRYLYATRPPPGEKARNAPH